MDSNREIDSLSALKSALCSRLQISLSRVLIRDSNTGILNAIRAAEDSIYSFVDMLSTDFDTESTFSSLAHL